MPTPKLETRNTKSQTPNPQTQTPNHKPPTPQPQTRCSRSTAARATTRSHPQHSNLLVFVGVSDHKWSVRRHNRPFIVVSSPCWHYREQAGEPKCAEVPKRSRISGSSTYVSLSTLGSRVIKRKKKGSTLIREINLISFWQ